MDSNIKIMRFLAITAIASFLITYMVHLNMEFRFLVLNTSWISNNLMFSIFSGAFASVVIALLLEIRQYKMNKVKEENQIFYDATILFSQFTILKYTLLRIKEQPNSIISSDAITMPVSQCEQIISSLHNVDYHSILKSDKLAMNLKEMNDMIGKNIAPFLFHAKFIQQAVIQDKILELQQTGKSTNPNYNSYFCKQTIDKLHEDIIPIVDDLTSCVRKIAQSVNRQDKLEHIIKDFTCFEDNYKTPSLEEYLAQ